MKTYLESAVRIVVADSYRRFDTYYSPGTSFVFALPLAIFGISLGVQVLISLQVILFGLANVLVALTSYQLFRSVRAAIVTSLATTLYWPFLGQTGFFMAELVFIVLLLSAQLIYFGLIVKGGTPLGAFWLGFILAIAMLVKGQAAPMVLSVGLGILLVRRFRHLLKFTPLMALGGAIVFSLQIGLNSAISGEFSPFLASSDAYVSYLGQSRRMSVGAYDRDSGNFSIFYHSSQNVDELDPPEVVPAALVDRDYFASRRNRLWADFGVAQFYRSLQGIVDLFTVTTLWPQRNNEGTRSIDLWSQWFAVGFVFFAAFVSLAMSFFIPELRWKVIVLFLPVLLLPVFLFFYMGEVRYFVPYQYNLFFLATPAYRLLSSILGPILTRSPSR